MARRSLFSATLASLMQNDVATGGIAVLAGGVGLAALRSMGKMAWAMLMRRTVLHAESEKELVELRSMLKPMRRPDRARLAKSPDATSAIRTLA